MNTDEQPKPESWLEIARETRKQLCDWIFSVAGHRFGHPKSVAAIDGFILSAIERSHVAQPEALPLTLLRELRREINYFKGHGMPGFTDRAAAYLILHKVDQLLAQPQSSKASPLGERSEPWIGGKCSYCGKDNGEHRDDCNAIFGKPQRSDQPLGSGRTTDDKQKEWTPNQLHELVMDLRVATGNYADIHRGFVEILDPWFKRHNAELAAERERREQAESAFKSLAKTELTLRLQFDSEREKWVNQYLSALAAIDHHCIEWSDCDGKIDVDLSALRKHDAEARKPLVDALEQAKALIGFLQSCVRSGEALTPKDGAYIRSVLDQADDALAEVKP